MDCGLTRQPKVLALLCLNCWGRKAAHQCLELLVHTGSWLPPCVFQVCTVRAHSPHHFKRRGDPDQTASGSLRVYQQGYWDPVPIFLRSPLRTEEPITGHIGVCLHSKDRALGTLVCCLQDPWGTTFLGRWFALSCDCYSNFPEIHFRFYPN